MAKSLNNFSSGGSETTNENNNNNNANLFIPRLRGNKKKKEKKALTKEEIWGKPIQRPDDWETWTFQDIHHGFKCSDHAHDQNKPLPLMEYWNYMRDTFTRVVGHAPAFDDPTIYHPRRGIL